MKVTKTTPYKIEVEYPELVIDYEILTSEEFEHRCTDFKNVMENQRRKCNLNTSNTMYKDRLDEIKVRLDNLIEEAQKIKHLLDDYDDETEEETMSIRIN